MPISHDQAIVQRTQQVCVVFRGYPGVGKTSLATALARKQGYVLLVKDDVRGPTLAHDLQTRKQLVEAGVDGSVSTLVDSNAACYTALLAVARTQFATGAKGVVFDGPYGKPSIVNDVSRMARELGVRTVLVTCKLDRELWVARLAARKRIAASEGRDDEPGGAHSVAHSALPDDPAQVEAHYPLGMNFPVKDIHTFVDIDCSVSIGECVEVIVDAVKETTTCPSG